ncbi:MAG: hypothetical protein HZC15_05010 [Candidatus Omnitrophica bacterium]|nr:hypothetical protein [Candidatus Omnitrophota bacterium]
MRVFVLVVMLVMCVLSFSAVAYSQDQAVEISKDKVVAIATESVKGQGISLEDVSIIYDQDGKLWSEKLGYAKVEDNVNHGILVKGFMKNYRIVYFDFKEPLKDIWVFVDKDTGEVLTVYREQ